MRKKIHFYEFNEKWDEWFSEDNLHKISHFLSNAEEPHDKVYSINVVHYRVTKQDYNYFKNRIGTPLIISAPSWFSWKDLYDDVKQQLSRYLKDPNRRLVQIPKERADTYRNEGRRNLLPSLDEEGLPYRAQPLPIENASNHLEQQRKKRFTDREVDVVGERTPFKITMIESSTSKCLQCTFTNKYKTKGKKYVDCKGCPIRQTSEKLKWMLGCF